MQVIKKMERDDAKGVLIIPEWKSAWYWPKVQSYINIQTFQRVIYFKGDNFTQKGRGQNGIFGKKRRAFHFTVLFCA